MTFNKFNIPWNKGRNGISDETKKKLSQARIKKLHEQGRYSEIRTCTKCHKQYPGTQEFFRRNRLGSLGLSAWCKMCAIEYDKKHRKENHLIIYEQMKKYRKARPEWVKHTKRRHYLKHQEEVKEKARKHRHDTPGYWKLTSEQYRVKSAIRRARKLSAGGNFTTEDILKQYHKQKGLCYWCEGALDGKYHTDHYIPLVRGGSNERENIVISCPKCNQSKGAKLPEEFLKTKCGGIKIA